MFLQLTEPRPSPFHPSDDPEDYKDMKKVTIELHPGTGVKVGYNSYVVFMPKGKCSLRLWKSLDCTYYDGVFYGGVHVIENPGDQPVSERINYASDIPEKFKVHGKGDQWWVVCDCSDAAKVIEGTYRNKQDQIYSALRGLLPACTIDMHDDHFRINREHHLTWYFHPLGYGGIGGTIGTIEVAKALMELRKHFPIKFSTANVEIMQPQALSWGI